MERSGESWTIEAQGYNDFCPHDALTAAIALGHGQDYCV
jgi:hypothetical protein